MGTATLGELQPLSIHVVFYQDWDSLGSTQAWLEKSRRTWVVASPESPPRLREARPSKRKPETKGKDAEHRGNVYFLSKTPSLHLWSRSRWTTLWNTDPCVVPRKGLACDSLQIFPPENKGVVTGSLKNVPPAQTEEFSWPILPFWRFPEPQVTAGSGALRSTTSCQRNEKTEFYTTPFLQADWDWHWGSYSMAMHLKSRTTRVVHFWH